MPLESRPVILQSSGIGRVNGDIHCSPKFYFLDCSLGGPYVSHVGVSISSCRRGKASLEMFPPARKALALGVLSNIIDQIHEDIQERPQVYLNTEFYPLSSRQLAPLSNRFPCQVPHHKWLLLVISLSANFRYPPLPLVDSNLAGPPLSSFVISRFQ